MRIPFAANLKSRAGAVTLDAKIVNGIAEVDGEETSVFKRPGNTDLGLVKAGVAQLLTYWNSKATTIQADYLNIGTVGTNYATWNSADKGTGLTLSNGSLTATSSAVAAEAGDGVRSTISKTTGKWYWEVTVGVDANVSIGVANASANLDTGGANYIGFDNNGLGILGSNGNIAKNGATVGTISALATSDIISIAYDADSGTVAFRKNNGTAVTLSGGNVPTGALFAAVGGQYGVAGATTSTTTNFGATAQTYAPPSGYTAGLYGVSNGFYAASSTALSPSTASLPFSAQDNGANAATSYLMFKNANQAWTLTSAGTLAAISDVDYPGTYAVGLTSLTRSGTVATATTATDTNFQVGSSVTIAGATPSDYNGAQVITGVTASTVGAPGSDVQISITRSGTTATATTVSVPHGLVNGASTVISGAQQPEYNGIKTITWISATQFSFTVTVTNAALTSPATGSPVILGQGVVFSYYNAVADYTKLLCTLFPPVTDTLVNGETLTLSTGNPLVDGARVVSSVSGLTFQLTVSGLATPTSSSPIFSYRANPTVSSITSSAGVATVTTSAAHNFLPGKGLQIDGATPTGYNGAFNISVTGTTTFTYPIPLSAESPATPGTGTIISNAQGAVIGASFTFAIGGAVTTPATGTITATGGRNTVPGIVYLNGRFGVMDVNGVIYDSDEDNPASWTALDYLTADSAPGAGVVLAQSLTFIVAFKEWSTEPFYDAKLPPPGSPWAKMENGITQVGCAQGWSLANLDGNLFWIAQTRAKGRCVYVMQGTQQQQISTPDIDRILNADDLATVHAFGIKVNGHGLYFLTLVTSNITLVYDMKSQMWGQATSLTLGSSKSVTTITRSGTTATVTTGTAHTVADGDPVKISGATQTDYNGIFQAAYVSPTVFTIEVANSPTTPATGTILAYPYTETYFKFTKFANCAGRYMVLHESDGHLYEILTTQYQDAGIPISVFTRTVRLDGGDLSVKTMAELTVVADKVSDTIMVRWSDDDMATSSTYRSVNLSYKVPMLRRCGAFERRTIETKHIGNNPLQLKAMELDIGA